MKNWEKDMIAGVNRNAADKAMERKLKTISARRKRKGFPFWRKGKK